MSKINSKKLHHMECCHIGYSGETVEHYCPKQALIVAFGNGSGANNIKLLPGNTVSVGKGDFMVQWRNSGKLTRQFYKCLTRQSEEYINKKRFNWLQQKPVIRFLDSEVSHEYE